MKLDDLPPLAELRELEPDPILDFDDAPVPAHLQALADESAEPEEPKDETSFRTLLTELDSMEEGLKPGAVILPIDHHHRQGKEELGKGKGHRIPHSR